MKINYIIYETKTIDDNIETTHQVIDLKKYLAHKIQQNYQPHKYNKLQNHYYAMLNNWSLRGKILKGKKIA